MLLLESWCRLKLIQIKFYCCKHRLEAIISVITHRLTRLKQSLIDSKLRFQCLNRRHCLVVVNTLSEHRSLFRSTRPSRHAIFVIIRKNIKEIADM